MENSTFRAFRLNRSHHGHMIWVSHSYNGTLIDAETVDIRGGNIDTRITLKMPSGTKQVVVNPNHMVTIY